MNLEISEKKPFSLGSDVIKYFAALAMLVDHLAWWLVDTYSPLGFVLHLFGRLTAPIMSFFIAEGFHYTRNVNRYLLRLGIFAVISWVSFIYMETGDLPIVFENGEYLGFYPMQSVIFTFFLALLSLKVAHSEKLNLALKIVIQIILCLLSLLGDWCLLPILWVHCFDRYRGNFKKQASAFAIASLMVITLLTASMDGGFLENSFQYGVLLALIPIYFYNGEKGRAGKINKWFFYVFYPLHMLVIGVIKYI